MAEQITPEGLWRAVHPALPREVDLSALTWDGFIRTLLKERETNRRTIQELERNLRRRPKADMERPRRKIWEAAACAALSGYLSSGEAGETDFLVEAVAHTADRLVQEWGKRFEKPDKAIKKETTEEVTAA